MQAGWREYYLTSPARGNNAGVEKKGKRHGSAYPQRLLNVETVEIHDFRPGSDEIEHKLMLVTVTGIHFCQ